MRRPAFSRTILISAAGLLMQSACNEGKPRHPPPDPMAVAAPPDEEVAAEAPSGPVASLTAKLVRQPQVAGFFLDHIGAAADPRTNQPAQTPADQPVVFDGFGFDPVAKAPGKGVDVVVDGRAFGAAYGAPRADVARFFKTPGLVNVGFRTTLPAGSLAPGEHRVVVRVVAIDGKSYFESPNVPFAVK